MKTSLYILAAVALLGMGCRADEEFDSVRTFELKQKSGKVLNTPARIRKALAKYGLESRMSPDRLNMASSTIDLSSVNVDVEYVGQIGIGTPPQKFSMDFDTGSADIWIPGSECTRCGSHSLFDAADSSSYQDMGNKTWTLRYGDGSGVYGVAGKDTVHLGDNLKYEGQVIGVATSETMDFAMDDSLDGIFGLSFPSLSFTGQKESIVESMKKSGAISNAQVGVYLGRARDGGKGELIFGGSNPNHYEGELKYIPVTDPKYWQVSLNGLKIGDKEALSAPVSAIVDTGTTLIILPSEVSKAIHAGIPGSHFSNMYGWRVPCDLKMAETDTQITFRLGEHEFPIRMNDLVRERAAPGAEGEHLCYSGIAEARTSLIILGDTFLRSYYSVYDFDKSAVGLAPAKA